MLIIYISNKTVLFTVTLWLRSSKRFIMFDNSKMS